ncbi:hypothetical protein [Anatilimnocola floriformis]|uniref:hypothetical protein n=1 Tax=Anatilimnocola floriformis TaxID=2948575 RepID=UPI0020C1C051|nr:hypothetical protein [Anatilimnocola floriformis]
MALLGGWLFQHFGTLDLPQKSLAIRAAAKLRNQSLLRPRIGLKISAKNRADSDSELGGPNSLF